MDQQASPSYDPQTHLRSPAHDSAPGRQAASTAAAGLPLRLSTAAERLAHHRHSRAAHGKATPNRFAALAVLEAAGPLRISDLAVRTPIGLPAMSRIVERLSQDGWAARHPDPTDHRACLVSITEAGTELLDAMRRERAGRLAAGLARLEPQQVAALLAALPVLESLAEHITAAEPSAPARPSAGTGTILSTTGTR
jgi:DNA-binding MarR family transcriptional regulator